jgi:hypothetical protein
MKKHMSDQFKQTIGKLTQVELALLKYNIVQHSPDAEKINLINSELKRRTKVGSFWQHQKYEQQFGKNYNASVI